MECVKQRKDTRNIDCMLYIITLQMISPCFLVVIFNKLIYLAAYLLQQILDKFNSACKCKQDMCIKNLISSSCKNKAVGCVFNNEKKQSFFCRPFESKKFSTINTDGFLRVKFPKKVCMFRQYQFTQES